MGGSLSDIESIIGSGPGRLIRVERVEIGYFAPEAARRETNDDDCASSLTITIHNSRQAVDLVARTESDDCPAHSAVAIAVASTLDVPIGVDWFGSDTCTMLPGSSLMATPCEQ